MANKFISLGGGDEIGGSCYFVHTGGYNFLFDVGVRCTSKRRYPSISELEKVEEIDTLNDLNCIFLSHAHYDHNGGLPVIASKLSIPKEIICTEYTKYFTQIQLNLLKKHSAMPEYAIYEDICVEKALDMLATYQIGQKIRKKDYSFTLYRAGHIPGAVMILVEAGGKKILYTGDFSDKDFPLVGKYSLPEIKDLDLLIINSTSVFKKDERWTSTWGDGERRVKDLVKRIFLYKQLNIEVGKVNNGLELAILVNNELEAGDFQRMGITIYVDEIIYETIRVIEAKEGKKFRNIQCFDEKVSIKDNGIYITLKKHRRLESMKKLHLNYSLHETYEGIKELILKLRAKKTLVTHYQVKENREDILKKELKSLGYEDIEYVVNEQEYEF